MTGSLQAATERDIGVPDFDRDEKDTILLQLGTLLGRSFPPHVKSIFFLVIFRLALVKCICLFHNDTNL